MAEDQHVGVGPAFRAASLPSGGRSGLVHHHEVQAGQIGGGDLGQPRPQVRPVVVAVNTDQPSGPCLEQVEQIGAHPVTGVYDDVGVLDVLP